LSGAFAVATIFTKAVAPLDNGINGCAPDAAKLSDTASEKYTLKRSVSPGLALNVLPVTFVNIVIFLLACIIYSDAVIYRCMSNIDNYF
jgi:hypothetical protein